MEDKPNSVVIGRESSVKQAVQGDSSDDQITQCTSIAVRDGTNVVRSFKVIESATKPNREIFDEVIAYCMDRKNEVKFLYFKNISRFTRGGNEEYLRLKRILGEGGVGIRDIYGTIRPSVNTMEIYGFEYSWSRYSPSQSEEAYQANRARDAVRDSLTVMIGAEIGYTRLGYWSRNSVYGFKNEKVETTEHGKRNILVPFEDEAKYMREMFRLLDEGKSEKEVVHSLNAQGMRTRKFNHRDRRTKVALGKGGGRTLTVKQLQRMKKKLVYAGIVCEKWTYYQPVVARFKGLVDRQVFNRVNDGIVKIVPLENGAGVKVLYGKELEAEKKTIRRLKNNPEYPFKDIRCPICGWPSKGSASRGKSGKHFPAYHCARGHKSWRVKKSDFHNTVYGFVRRLHMKPSYVRLFEETFLEVWKESRVNLIEESKLAGENVANLSAQ
jgi:site-specific DNA recombinase